MKKTLSLLILSWCILCTSTWAAPKLIPLKVDGNIVQVVKSFPITITAPVGADIYDWRLPSGMVGEATDNVMIITASPKGAHKISVLSVTIDFVLDDKGKIKKTITKDRGEVQINVGDVPGPGPGPDPDPDPTPGPDAPIAGPGFRVLMIYNALEKAKYPLGQLAVLEGKQTRDYLLAKCIVDDQNKNGAFRIWSDETDVSTTSKPWQDAFKAKRASTPWIIVSNGKTGYTGPLPKDPEECLTLFQKYAVPTSAGRNKKEGK